MFKNSIIATAMLSSIAGSAFAGNPAPAEVITVPVAMAAPQTTDWSGFYVGGLAATSTAVASLYDNGVFDRSADMSGEQIGAFAGYNFNLGSVVLGGELAYSTGPIAYLPRPGFNLDNIIDLKARVGMPVGKALLYGVVGGSFGTYSRDALETVSSTGLNYGAGVDFQVSDRVFVGVEYLARDMLSEASTINTSETFGQETGSVQIRVGVGF